MTSPSPKPSANSPAGDRQKPPKEKRLPFEPKNQKKGRSVSKSPPDSATPTATAVAPAANASAPIPQVVSRRMTRRMAVFSGLPTLLGLLTFPCFYVVVKNEWFEVPNVLVVLVSMGFFGLGVLGLSYGVLSASWDEEQSGTKLGWGEFRTNFGRLITSWRSGTNDPKNS